jgi:sulfur carrier protein ThiS
LSGETERRKAEVSDNVELILVGLLRTYGPHHTLLAVETGQTVSDVIRELGLNPDLVAIVMVNGRQESKGHRLQPGDQVKLLPLVGGG